MNTQPARGWLRPVQRLHPGYFAFVMATGIISTGLYQWNQTVLSRALLGFASVGLVILTIALIIRMFVFPKEVGVDVRSPERSFGFFTITAGLDVLGVRLFLASHPGWMVALLVLAGLVWLALTYGVPAGLLLGRARESVLGGVNGSWLTWVVATQSLAIASCFAANHWTSSANVLAPIGIGLWSVGVFLYLLLISLIWLKWLTVQMEPAALGPAYWILMGATAISVLAGARILSVISTLPEYVSFVSFVKGLSFALWAFGTWYVPLIVILGLWRHVTRHWTLAYEPTLWSMVFPLGMYNVATYSLGQALGLPFMLSISRVGIWIALVVWALVGVGFLRQFQPSHLRSQLSEVASPHVPSREAESEVAHSSAREEPPLPHPVQAPISDPAPSER